MMSIRMVGNSIPQEITLHRNSPVANPFLLAGGRKTSREHEKRKTTQQSAGA
jgi:hypothetical protein